MSETPSPKENAIRQNDIGPEIAAIKQLATEFNLTPTESSFAEDDFYWFLVLKELERSRNLVFQIFESQGITNLIGPEKSELTAQQLGMAHAIEFIQKGALDSKTKAWDRRTLVERMIFSQSLASNESGQSKEMLLLHFFDLDKFKLVNDTYGHLFGDELLIKLVENIKKLTRSQDSVYRYGGEEFCLLQIINKENYKKAAKEKGVSLSEFIIYKAEELRQQISENTKLTITANELDEEDNEIEKIIEVATLSAGVTQLKLDEDPSRAIERADELMYDAKHNGRNTSETDLSREL